MYQPTMVRVKGRTSEKFKEGNCLSRCEEDKKMADTVKKFETHGEKLMYG